mmetsp:Transcript_148698/g.477505  ORF Transcript_148698/g.477505 Transcript_148698/m.477505 type:complete len:157 (-) Transcript_148698:663-1133(-)
MFAGRIEIDCRAFFAVQPLCEVARLLGSAQAFIGAHGAGLANLVFLRPGSRLFELDAVAHRHHNAHIYQIVGELIGLRPEKVWLDYGSGTRVFPPAWDILNCTMQYPNGSVITGIGQEDYWNARILPKDGRARVSIAQFRLLVGQVLEEWEAGAYG